MSLQPLLRQERGDDDGEQQGDDEGRGHGHRQGLEEAPRHSAQEGQGREHHQSGGGRADQGAVHLPRGHQDLGAELALGGVRRLGVELLKAAHQVLEHDDHVIDHEANRGGHPAERHHVEAHAQHEQEQAGGGEHCREHDRGHRHQAERAQEQQQHRPREQGADQDRIPHAARRAGDEFGLVVVDRALDVRRCLRPVGFQLGLHGLHHGDAVSARATGAR